MMWRSLAVAVVVVVVTMESILMGVDAIDDVDISGANMVRCLPSTFSGLSHKPHSLTRTVVVMVVTVESI